VGEQEGARWIYPLTHRGKALAEAFQEGIATTSYANQLIEEDELSAISHDHAIEYGEKCCLCAEVMQEAPDRVPLLDAFFRFDQTGTDNPHVCRRLTLGLLLDLVEQSAATPFADQLRPALYLSQLAPDHPYQARPALADWFQRWRMVQVRHAYTSALQCIWALFLDHLAMEDQITPDAFMAYVDSCIPDATLQTPLSAYLDQCCQESGLEPNWHEAHPNFHTQCDITSEHHELTLFAAIWDSRRDPEVMVNQAMRILSQLFLRHYSLWQEHDNIWQEMATAERVPLNQFMEDCQHHLDRDSSYAEWLHFLIMNYCLGQHEATALQKLRANSYNTFKFYFQQDKLVWARNPANYQVPLRFPGLRLNNALSILIDLGLVDQDEGGICRLTADGEQFLARVVESDHGT
ncbi:MAG: hypothetical protein KDE28_23440, partial [Anaerolineales bacterium]|nr:hypothetical protein [Anaerolineales bacterium]